jgi:hypothetical protein
MTGAGAGTLERRRGVALVMALAAIVLLGSLGLVATQCVLVRGRLAADARWRTEGEVVAASALASVRVAHRADLDTLSDGAALLFPGVTRADGWSWSAAASRSGPLIRLTVAAIRRAADGTPYAARRASLLLSRDPADTVRVLARRARF